MVTLWALYLRLYRETRPNSSRLSTPSAPCLQYNHTQHLLLINLTCVPIMIHNLLVLGGRVSRILTFAPHFSSPAPPMPWSSSSSPCFVIVMLLWVLSLGQDLNSSVHQHLLNEESSSSCFASNPPARVPSWLDSTENWPISIIAVLAFNFRFH